MGSVAAVGRTIAAMVVVAGGVAGCTEEVAGPARSTGSPTADASGPSTSTPLAGQGADSELCALFQEVKDFDDTLQSEVAETLAPLFELDPEKDDVEAEAERVMGELQDIVAGVDRERIRDLYTRLSEVVPEGLRDEAIALRDGTIALIDILLALDPDELEDIDAHLATPEVIAAGAATLALDELSQDECGIVIAN